MKISKAMFGGVLSLALLVAGISSPAFAVPLVLTFEGLQDNESVDQFYNGGTGSLGSGPGTNFGIGFSNAVSFIDADAGGTGNFGGEPSPSTAITFLGASATTMNVAAGFDTGFSFFYTAIVAPGVIRVWSDLDGTGSLLAELDLPVTPFEGAPDPTGVFSPFLPFGVAFDGIAHSVDFSGTANQIGFDNITLGAERPIGPDQAVPEPGSLLLLSAGLAAAGFLAKRRLQFCK
jgi:hypothetical protein